MTDHEGKLEFPLTTRFLRRLVHERIALAIGGVALAAVGLVRMIGLGRSKSSLFWLLAGLACGVAYIRTSRFFFAARKGDYNLILTGTVLSVRRGEEVPIEAITSVKFDRFFFPGPVRARIICDQKVSWRYRRFSLDLRIYDRREELILALKRLSGRSGVGATLPAS